MENRILGLHHITAIAGEAQRNVDFYTKVLGLRLVKKTVNFDDPGTYHLYYGDRTGSAGSILTFFPWEGIQQGRAGAGMATEIAYSIPENSLPFWKERLSRFDVKTEEESVEFGERVLGLSDPDGLQLKLVVSKDEDPREGWTGSGIGAENAIRGFHGIVLTLRNMDKTARILTDIFNYRLLSKEGDRTRFVTDATPAANIVDIVEDANAAAGINAGGTNHHVAFRVSHDTVLMAFREKIRNAGLSITDKIDRNYFYSLYFREPGGVLFELASDNPGFAIDEPVDELGTHLMLPAQYESNRERIENWLPVLQA